jgi:hypothetical protein
VNPHRHDPRDCSTTTCRYCGPDAGMWAIGEAVVTPFVLTGQILWWLACHPLVAVILIAAGLVAAAVLGAF